MDYDRYSSLRDFGTNFVVPFIEIPKNKSDKYFIYKKGKTRLDIVSYEYYGEPDYGWLILQANPEFGSIEFEIKDGSELRVPFPLADVLAYYTSQLQNYKKDK